MKKSGLGIGLQENVDLLVESLNREGEELEVWIDDPDWEEMDLYPSVAQQDIMFSLGYIRGAAAALGLTAIELLDQYDLGERRG